MSPDTKKRNTTLINSLGTESMPESSKTKQNIKLCLDRAHHICHLITDNSCNKKDESETKFIQAETVKLHAAESEWSLGKF